MEQSASKSGLHAFIIGLMAGAIGGMLLAPTDGKKSRDTISKRAHQVKDKISKKKDDISDKAENVSEDVDIILTDVTE